jgi:peptidoglycan hydrolase-like protein with peptidoglycan-binding domain
MNTKSKLFFVGAMCFGAFLCGAIVSTVLNAQNESSIAAPAFTPPVFSFQKNLKFGDSNQDVRQLQIVLNSDAGTRVSSSGIGSKGQESTYFGQLTQNAVMRFQAKYRKEVLEPYAIYSPTGFVGVATRAKLNQIISTKTIVSTASSSSASLSSVASLPPTISTSSVSGALSLSKEPLPRLYTLRPQQIKKGDTFTLVGAGFETENTIYIGGNTFSHVLSQDSSNISFTIPATSTIQNGTYEVWIENTKGMSKIPGQVVNLTITDNPQPTPTISSVLPATISGAETVTVIGTGFAPSGNDVISGFGTIKNLSSNGTQISFSPRSLISAEVISRIPAGMTIKVDFYVANTTGVSNIFGSVNLKL